MTDATGPSPARATTDSLVDQAVILCPSCGSWQDVWTATCGCGEDLLADDRKIKIMKSHAEPPFLMQKRAHEAEESQDPAQWEQAVRDLAALRRIPDASGGDGFKAIESARIARLLLKLGRLDEAVAEAESLHQHKALPADVIVSLSQRYELAGDLAGADQWLECGFTAAGDDLKGRVPLVCERARLLTDHGRSAEAAAMLKQLETELNAAIKATEKSGGATAASLVGADTKAYAISMWTAETKALNAAMAHTKQVVKAEQHAEHEAAKAAKAAQRAAEGKTHWWQM